jgi:hypothetical protein
MWNGKTCPNCGSPHTDSYPDYQWCFDCGHKWGGVQAKSAPRNTVLHGVDCRCVQCLADAVVRKASRRP